MYICIYSKLFYLKLITQYTHHLSTSFLNNCCNLNYFNYKYDNKCLFVCSSFFGRETNCHQIAKQPTI